MTSLNIVIYKTTDYKGSTMADDCDPSLFEYYNVCHDLAVWLVRFNGNDVPENDYISSVKELICYVSNMIII